MISFNCDQYIRVENQTNAGDMIKFMYSRKGWQLEHPKLILSVIGCAHRFTLPYRLKKAFKRGLIKAATSTGAWIISGGTNSGVGRLVGEAVAEEYIEYTNPDIVLLGIATWGKIAMRREMTIKVDFTICLFLSALVTLLKLHYIREFVKSKKAQHIRSRKLLNTLEFSNNGEMEPV